MDQLDQMLVGLTHLKSLTLDVLGHTDLLDARRWETLTTGLRSFTFKFYLSDRTDPAGLRFFSTPYWTEEKRWYVARYGRCVFSGASFLPDHFSLPKDDRRISTASHINLICSRATKLTLNTDRLVRGHRFPCVTTLELTCSISSTTITKMIDMRRIVRLDISSLVLILPFLPLQSSLPHLTKLCVEQSVTAETAILFRGQQLKQIRELRIRVADEHNDYITEELLRIFPSVTNLTYISRALSVEAMMHVVERMTQLRNTRFYSGSSFMSREQRFCTNPDLFLQESGRFNGKHISCRVFGVARALMPCGISWKIDQHIPIPRSIHPENSAGIDRFHSIQTPTQFRLKEYLLQRGYYWHLCKYMITCDRRIDFLPSEYFLLCILVVTFMWLLYHVLSTLPRLLEMFLWGFTTAIIIFMDRTQKRVCKYLRGCKHFLIKVCFYSTMNCCILVMVCNTFLSMPWFKTH